MAVNEAQDIRSGIASHGFLHRVNATGPSLPFLLLASFLLLVGVYFTVSVSGVERDSRIVASSVPPAKWIDTLKALSEEDRQKLQTREVEALLADPLDQVALKNLSLMAKAQGDSDRSRALAILAGNRSLRDTRAQAEVLEILLERKDYVGALYRLDGLLRSNPPRRNELLAVTALFAEVPQGRSALIAVLAENPPWRAELIDAVAKRPNGDTIVYALLSDLRKSQAPATTAELRAFLTTLVSQGKFELAYYVWLDFLSEVELRKVASIYDGGFDLEAKNLIFGWTFNPLRSAEIRIVPRATSSTDRMLRIVFYNLRDRFANVSQLLRLAPGIYVLSGETKAESLETEVGLVWRLYCLDKGEHPIGETTKLPTALAWTRFETQISIPDQGCQTQRLRLEVNAKAVLDRKISGTFFLDQMTLTRMGD